MHQFKVGAKLWLDNEKKPFTIKACDERYAICTKPFNLRKTVFYTIIDFKEGVRGANNLIFNHYDYEEKESAGSANSIVQCLKDLNSGSVEISHRNRVGLNIVKADA